MVKEGPFQNIVDVFFPDEGGGGTSNIKIGCYVLWGIWKPNTYGWKPIFSDTINGQPSGNSNVVRVMSGMTPEDVDAPADVYGELQYDEAQGQYYRVVTRVTGDYPRWEPGQQYIDFVDPVPRNYYSGSTCTARGWTVVFREYYFFLGIHHHELISSVEFGVPFSASGVVLRGTDGVLYTGGTFEEGGFGFLIVTQQ